MMSELKQKRKVLIVGAGLAGLCCAKRLHAEGIDFELFESEDSVGGRVKTEELSGFKLDCGFQVLLTSYPEARDQLDFESLQLGRFEPGAMIFLNGQFQRFTDPWRRPLSVLSTLFSSVATFSDKLKVAKLKSDVKRSGFSAINAPSSSLSTLQFLKERGFSDKIIHRFFRPFFSGVFLESELATSSAKFEYLFHMFSIGDASLPANGMRAIPHQLASHLPSESIHLNSTVTEINGTSLRLADGRDDMGTHLVLATPQHVSGRLLSKPSGLSFHAVYCHYFAADKSPMNSNFLVLNGEGKGPINNLCVPSDVCPSYAPDGKALISVTVLNEAGNQSNESNVEAVKEQLCDWFGQSAEHWQHLKSYFIPYAIPETNPSPKSGEPAGHSTGDFRIADNTFSCGDHVGIASIQSAMESGRLVAESILNSA